MAIFRYFWPKLFTYQGLNFQKFCKGIFLDVRDQKKKNHESGWFLGYPKLPKIGLKSENKSVFYSLRPQKLSDSHEIWTGGS